MARVHAESELGGVIEHLGDGETGTGFLEPSLFQKLTQMGKKWGLALVARNFSLSMPVA